MADQTTHHEFKCKDCGAVLKYAPGTTALKCQYCGAANEIGTAETSVADATQEINFEKFIANQLSQEERTEIVTVKCSGCGATVSLKPHVTSDHCPFCGTNIVVTGGTTSSLLKPRSLLPFKIEIRQAMESFKKWLHGLWFAPSDLKRYAQADGRLDGMYLPYWTYDSKTSSDYRGQRGDNYQVSEQYTAVENGRSVTKTRTVTKIRWTPVSGHVKRNFDDVLVCASRSLPQEKVASLEPWDLKDLVPFQESYLSGYRTESYQVEVTDGFGMAKAIMAAAIEEAIRRDIGGDHQRIDTVHTGYDAVTFKHILLPLWISAYRYHSKVYRFLVNARTGEVQGERPWSWIKITLAVLAALAVLGAILYFNQGRT